MLSSAEMPDWSVCRKSSYASNKQRPGISSQRTDGNNGSQPPVVEGTPDCRLSVSPSPWLPQCAVWNAAVYEGIYVVSTNCLLAIHFFFFLCPNSWLEYRAVYQISSSPSVLGRLFRLSPCLKPHLTSLSFYCSPSHVSFGRPLFLFPSGAHVIAVLSNESGSILKTCPSHCHLRILTCSLTLVYSVFVLTSAFVIFIGQWILRIFLRHFCWNMSSLSSSGTI